MKWLPWKKRHINSDNIPSWAHNLSILLKIFYALSDAFSNIGFGNCLRLLTIKSSIYIFPLPYHRKNIIHKTYNINN